MICPSSRDEDNVLMETLSLVSSEVYNYTICSNTLRTLFTLEPNVHFIA